MARLVLFPPSTSFVRGGPWSSLSSSRAVGRCVSLERRALHIFPIEVEENICVFVYTDGRQNELLTRNRGMVAKANDDLQSSQEQW